MLLFSIENHFFKFDTHSSYVIANIVKVMQGVVHRQGRIDGEKRVVKGNKSKKLQLTSQPQYKQRM